MEKEFNQTGNLAGKMIDQQDELANILDNTIGSSLFSRMSSSRNHPRSIRPHLHKSQKEHVIRNLLDPTQIIWPRLAEGESLVITNETLNDELTAIGSSMTIMPQRNLDLVTGLVEIEDDDQTQEDAKADETAGTNYPREKR